MAENYYPDAEEPVQSSSPDESTDVETEEDDQETQSGGALVPKSMCANAKPGDTMTFKVVHVYEDEVELEPVTKSKPTTTKEPMSFDDEVDMVSEGE